MMKTRIYILLAAMLLTVASVQAQTATTISVDVASSTIPVGDDVYVDVTLNAEDAEINAIATLTVTNSDNSYNETFHVALEDGYGRYCVPNLAVGTYSITASFAGNEQYAASTSETKTVQVNNIITALALSLKDEAIYVGDFTGFIVELQNDNKQILHINAVATVRLTDKETFNEATDKVYTVGLVHGKYSETDYKDCQNTLIDLPAGTYKLKATFAGNEKYTGCESNVVTLTVSKIATTLTVADITPITAGRDAIVNVTATPSSVPSCTVTVDGTDYTVALVDGKGTCIIPNLAKGDYEVSASIAADDKYLGSTATKQVTVSEGTDPAIERNAVVTVTTTPKDYTGNVTVTVDGKDYYVAIINGTGKVVLPQLAANTYGISASIAGNDKYLGISNEDALITSVPGVTFPFAEGQTWMTWCDDWAWLKPEGVKAYTLSAVNGTAVTLTEVTGDNIPSHKPLLLEKTGDAVTPTRVITGTVPDTGYDNTTGIASTAATGFTYYGNAGDDAIAAADLDGYVFAFGNAEGKQSYILFNGDFIVVDNATTGIAAHRCWLNVGAGSSNARQLKIVFGDTTPLLSPEGEDEGASPRGGLVGVWFSLDGRRLDGKPTKKGVFINNNRKVMVR